jgi:hypothetical protein
MDGPTVVVTCSSCGQANRVPEAFKVRANCGKCKKSLSADRIVHMLSGGAMRGLDDITHDVRDIFKGRKK